MKTYNYKINGNNYDVTIRRISGQHAEVEVNGIPFDVEMQGSQLTEDALPDSEATPMSTAPTPVTSDNTKDELTPAPTSTTAPGKGTPVKAPLPGVVTKINVKSGDAVSKGQTVLVLEAMKMENNIAAETAGTITAVCVKPGESVLEGTVLLTIG